MLNAVQNVRFDDSPLEPARRVPGLHTASGIIDGDTFYGNGDSRYWAGGSSFSKPASHGAFLSNLTAMPRSFLALSTCKKRNLGPSTTVLNCGSQALTLAGMKSTLGVLGFAICCRFLGFEGWAAQFLRVRTNLYS